MILTGTPSVIVRRASSDSSGHGLSRETGRLRGLVPKVIPRLNPDCQGSATWTCPVVSREGGSDPRGV